MGKGKLILFGIIALILALGAYSYAQSLKPGKFDSFADCLSQNGVKMFGAYWCPRCAEQKAMFGKSFDRVPYVECAIRGQPNNIQTTVCRENNIQSYPTWEFADGTRAGGVLQIDDLSLRSGCPVTSS